MATLASEVAAPNLGAPYMQKPLDVVDTAFALFGFLPEDDDPRWHFLSRYTDIQQETHFGRMNFANAWGATYLSDVVSYRSGFVTTANPENGLQLDRALDNLEAAPEVAVRYATSSPGFADYTMHYTLTDRLTFDPCAPPQPVTPCPEALYQIRLYADDAYLARVGFNIHQEADTDVLSIVNIQGIPGGLKRNRAFTETYNISPFNLLVRRVISLANERHPYDIRGLVNPERGNPQLYYGVLVEEDVSLYHAQRAEY